MGNVLSWNICEVYNCNIDVERQETGAMFISGTKLATLLSGTLVRFMEHGQILWNMGEVYSWNLQKFNFSWNMSEIYS